MWNHAAEWHGILLSEVRQGTLQVGMNIRIVHVISDLSVGGAEIMLCKLVAETDRRRFDPHVICLRNSGPLRRELETLNVPVYSLEMKHSLPTIRNVWRLFRLIRQLRPHIIHGWMYHGNLAAQSASILAPDKPVVIWSVHQSLYGNEYQKLLTNIVIRIGAMLSGRPHKIIYNSKTSAAQHEAIGFNRDKSSILHYGFDTDRFAPSLEARLSVRKEFGMSPDALIVGLVGRYHPIKDHNTFIRAATVIVKFYPDIRFVLCGRDVDWSNSHLAKAINELKLAKNVHLLNYRSDIARIISSLDIAVLASVGEGFPNVIGEAMSCGVPCVVTDVSDLAWLIDGTGCVVPPRAPLMLASALQDLLKRGHTARRELGRQARERVIKYFSLREVSSKYEALYSDLLNRQYVTNQIEIGRSHGEMRVSDP